MRSGDIQAVARKRSEDLADAGQIIEGYGRGFA